MIVCLTMPDPSAPTLAFFAHERGDARVRKRVAALQAQGWQVQGYMFHRVRDKVDEPPFWENVELGITENRRYLKRVLVMLGSLRLLWRHRQALREVSVLYAVNTDNALLALMARWMAGCSSPAEAGAARIALVLELADVQPAMLGRGLRGRIMRAVERFVLGRTALLVTTSPGFVRHYFTPLQRFSGPIFLLENKVYPSTALGGTAPTATRLPARGGQPWVIGLFGALRCRRSIELMRELASQFPNQLHFYLRGYPSGTDAAGITALLGGLPNLEWGGAYDYPSDLAEMYGRIDLNWTFDFSDAGANSAWLLPNRIYEGGLFGCPALADATTETGRWVAERGVGWTLSEPLESSLADFLKKLGVPEWQEKQDAAASLPDSATRGEQDYASLAATLAKLTAGETLEPRL